MDPIRNPYTPNAGAMPGAVVGRDDQLASFDTLLGRLRRGRTEQSMIVTGLRGVGKTVLLGRFRQASMKEGWVVVELAVSKSDEEHFRKDIASKLRSALYELSPRAKWNNKLERAAAALKSFTLQVQTDGTLAANLDVGAQEGVADHGDLTLDLTDLLVSLGEAASSRESGVVLLFDEVQFLSRPQLEAVIAALHKCVQRTLPITMVGAGLPQIAELAGDAKSYAERLFKFPSIGNLDKTDARRALAEPAEDENVRYTSEALDLALQILSLIHI